ncbi:MAG TPA: YifB family Mg chelatase-like AAA ATPase [Candidatus Babeliales bacterium]|nr:YifB family Mg chelatase-like AAA ATPase [Candidatus Babeliales bacterium]
MHAKLFSASTVGVQAHLVEVEVDLSLGLINFHLLGLPDTAIKESRRRILTALQNSGIKIPERKITVNLAPASLKKEGTLFDLPIAVGLLLASRMLELTPAFLQTTLFIGELSLDGQLKPVRGVLPIVHDLRKAGIKRIIVAADNALEAALIKEVEVLGVHNLVELVQYLRGELPLTPTVNRLTETELPAFGTLDFAQVRGQQQAKRALQISAAGRHNVLFIGSPGAGKTMLAKRLPTIMPPLAFAEILETSKVYSVSGKLERNLLAAQRPFRNPHHTISEAGLVGGGVTPQPGEVSLAHHGILFLDELTEFRRSTLDVMRQPLESGVVSIARANHTVEFPAQFLLVAALNPCPCGYFGDKKRACICTRKQIKSYLGKISGPLLDRIDIQVPVQALEYTALKQPVAAELSSAQLFTKVAQALQAQQQRFGTALKYNSQMETDEIERYCQLTPAAEAVVALAFDKLNLSMRGYHKVLKVARTIADLDDYALIELKHVQEALLYRSLDHNLEQGLRDNV